MTARTAQPRDTMLPEPQLIPLSYHADSRLWFALLRHLPHAAWLDSGQPASGYGRFDILCAAPSCHLTTQGDLTTISAFDGAITTSAADPFALIQQQLGALQPKPALDLPFYGGALGYFGYDLARRLEKLPSLAQADISIADMSVGIYPWAIIQDHLLKRAWLVKNPALAPAYNFLDIEHICSQVDKKAMFHDLKGNLNTSENPFKISGFEADLKLENYLQALTKIQAYINAGDCYEVNFAQRFCSEYRGDPLAAYLAIRAALPSPFSGYLQLEQGAILSFSPERFIEVRGSQVQTMPIKGTAKRGATPDEDTANAEWLSQSPKNRAENLMIVDLLRNDLSKHCTQVKVPEFCQLQSFANVHHLVSTVSAVLKPEATAIDVLRDSFPGGSITGAPKIRAMEIIEELEPSRRNLYCGSLGYISADGQMDTNIAIRTLVCTQDKMYCWGGGGIVADSDPQSEYQETLAKVSLLMHTLEAHFHKR